MMAYLGDKARKLPSCPAVTLASWHSLHTTIAVTALAVLRQGSKQRNTFFFRPTHHCNPHTYIHTAPFAHVSSNIYKQHARALHQTTPQLSHYSGRPPNPTPKTMETTHRKIELQSPLDLTFLQDNATLCLREKLDLHFPPSAAPASASDDTLKSRVEELVSQYLQTVFRDAKANLAINGLEGKEMDEALKMAEGKGEGEFLFFFSSLRTARLSTRYTRRNKEREKKSSFC